MTATPESLLAAGAGAIAAAVREGKASATAIVEASFARAAAVDAGPRGLNCILSSDRDASLRAVESAPVGGALAGVPVVLKDNIATTTLSTSCGSKILEGYVSPYESAVARKLREAGAILVGKGNMDEFAMGSSTEFSAYGPARNPTDRTRVPGGSSGGSAAAVAAGIVPIAFGSETGGSVRQPAAFCGVVGVKPTYGRVSRF
ncbi:MAG TPA: amidase family protein, partial [Gemmatimonadaceae bacterium]|nr:amidase family protein [Gemmatimonadaceae bacterium]